MSRPMLSVPRTNPFFHGACNGIPTGRSGSCGASSGTATAITVTTTGVAHGRGPTVVQVVRRPSARLPFDAGHLVRVAGDALQTHVELGAAARVDRDGTSRVECAAGGWRERTCGFARQHTGFAPEVGDGIDECLRVRVRRVADDLIGGADLDDAAEVH